MFNRGILAQIYRFLPLEFFHYSSHFHKIGGEVGCISIEISLAEFLDGFFNGWYLEIAMECIICDIPGALIIPRSFD